MKKIVFHVFVLILALFVLCGCEDTVPPEFPWEYNLEEHWKTDENGEIITTEAVSEETTEEENEE